MSSYSVYTDGACVNNGYPNATAGIGVYWPHRPSWNISSRLIDDVTPVTSQRAELMAALEAANTAVAHLRGKRVKLYTDSQYVCSGMNEWRLGWERNGFRNANGEEIANRAMWRQFIAQVKEFRSDGSFDIVKVPGHSYNAGYDEAHELAQRGLKQSSYGALMCA